MSTDYKLYNLPEEYKIKLSEEYKIYAKYDRVSYINHDCIIYSKDNILKKDIILLNDGCEYSYKKGEIITEKIDLNFEEVVNLLKPYLRSEKINEILK